MLTEVKGLKNNSNIPRSDEFIINEINERSKNLIIYVNECESNQLDVRITYDNKPVSNIIKSILDSPSVSPVPLKAISLGRYLPGKLRPIKAIFASASDIFDVLKNKKQNYTTKPYFDN